MDTTFWSRRRVLGVLAATTAAVATSSVVLKPVAARADNPPANGSDGDPFNLPGTDRAKVVKAWLLGGKATRAAAETALIGSDADIQTFLTDELAKVTAEDNRVAIATSLAGGGKGTRRAASRALDGGDAAITDYLKGGFKAGILEDLRVATTTVMATGARAVRREGSAALDAGDQAALERFLIEGQYTARLEDMRFEVARLLVKAGPELRKYASRALSGTGRDVEWFLDTGQHIARARDQEAATIEELVAVVEREGKRADAKTKLAEEAAARAESSAKQAKKAADAAAAEAKAARNDVVKSGKAARKAAGAAHGAADSARAAIRASHAAVQASRRAAYAAIAASQAAATAGSAAARAYGAAIAASKDASRASAAKATAVAARNAASRARSAAEAADHAASASAQAASAGSAAASAARNAAAAANASATAASAAGKAQAEAAEARRQARIANTNASIATNAAGTAQAWANAAATAARTARDDANSAAHHAEKAAEAADWAAKYAGQAVDYANKCTEFANEATKAANTATKAVTQAAAVEKKAREAEWQRLDEDLKQAIEESRLLAQIEEQEKAELTGRRTQAEQAEKTTKDLISQAESALKAGETGRAATVGRKAAIALMNAHGAWSREAARFALSGTDADIHAWLDTDRQLAQQQDDRETLLYLAQISTPEVAEAATKALESETPEAAAAFLTTGVIEAGATDNRVAVARILADNPGKAVKKAASDALDPGTAQALYAFLSRTFEATQREDDAVTTATVLATAGPYTKAHAQAALEGPAWMRHHFLTVVQYKTAQLDYDSATHIAAIQGAIAAAAKVAHKAQEEAAHAQQTAAKAHNRAAEALKWADRANNSAKQAAHYAKQADAKADAAEQSAKNAQASADKARHAAGTARTAARSANYSANRAVDAAHRAVASANSAQNSAVSARSSAIQAGRDAKTAAAASTQAHRIAVAKRKAEIIEAARKAVMEIRKATKSRINPADTPENDKVKDDLPWWKEGARWLADASNTASIAAGFIAAGSGITAGALALFGAELPAAFAAGIAKYSGYASLAFSGISALSNGIGYGWNSRQFKESAASAALGLITFGQSKWIGTLANFKGASKLTKFGVKITEFGHDLISPITGWLGS